MDCSCTWWLGSDQGGTGRGSCTRHPAMMEEGSRSAMLTPAALPRLMLPSFLKPLQLGNSTLHLISSPSNMAYTAHPSLFAERIKGRFKGGIPRGCRET